MKLKNLLLGSVTAAGLMTGAAYAADLGVLTSVDVCDQLGISGLTISSDTNCLKISGEVSYAFTYGDWDTAWGFGDYDTPQGGFAWGYDYAGDGNPGVSSSAATAKLNFEATADSTFGPAKAVIKLINEDIADGHELEVDEAYVSIGEGTVIMAGHKGSIYNTGDDAPLNWLGLFNSEKVDAGVGVDHGDGQYIGRGADVVQITHDLGNGFSISGGLEDLGSDDDNSSVVGVLAYSSEGISAHVSVLAEVEDILSGVDNEWEMHAGITATLDTLKVVAAVASDSDEDWNVLGSVQASFDMFTLAASAEATDDDYTGAGASITAEVAEGVTLNVGGRWFDYDGDTAYEVAVGAEASVAENLTLSGAVGYVDETEGADSSLVYGWAKLAWAPGGGFTASVKGTVVNPLEVADYIDDYGMGYKIETEFKKTFE